MTDQDPQIPESDTYASDKWKFLAALVVSALTPVGAVVGASVEKKLPRDVDGIVLLFIAMMIAVATTVATRGIPTRRHVAAMRIAGGVMRRIDELTTISPADQPPLERLQTSELQAIVEKATAPRSEETGP